ncbi:DUF7507 domain-containing protein [Lysinibacter cavernae]|uniref:DUF7507 domain-containing protein n=1 Tax=Lysinibacter cavernae TaxID=1640652 RepID=A0A7X5TT67_9MICO|nr:hypothetical protein [Lysinibacter cavernae]NIH52973.1 hypothetical protein [Lysinibacter cavernae]
MSIFAIHLQSSTLAHTNGRRTFHRAVVVGLIVSLLLVLLPRVTAHAATGDYTIEMTGPTTVPVSESVVYDVTLRAEANTGAPLTGVTLTAVLAAGLSFDPTSIDTSPSSPVASASYAAGTRTVTIVMRDLSNALSSFSFSTIPTNRALKSDATVYSSTLSGSTSANGVTPEPSTVVTQVTGNYNYSPAKTATTLGGSNNRLVTYYFNVFTDDYTATTNTFTSAAQRLTDEFPAGTILRQISTGQGSWNVTATPGDVTTAPWQATWTNTSNYGPSSIGISGTFDTIFIIVEYPEGATFPNGSRPPVNTVGLEVLPVGGNASDPTAWRLNDVPERRLASAQGPVMNESTGNPVFSVIKAGQNSAISGNFQNNYTVSASYSDGGSGQTLINWTVEDSARSLGNQAFWGHTEIRRLAIQPNPALQTANTPFVVEYTYADLNAPTTDAPWKQVGAGLDGTGTPTVFLSGAGAQSIVFNNTGSTRYKEFAAWIQEDIPVGTVITGWRVVLGTAGEPAPSGAQVLMTANYTSMYASYIDGSTSTAAIRNTAQASAVMSGGGTIAPVTNSYAVTFLNSANVTTNLTAPTSLQVNGAGTYVAGIVNQNTNASHNGAVLKVVLPTGILYDETVGVTPYAATVRGTGQPIPPLGDGVTLTTEMIAGPDGPQQVVTLTFAELPSMRPVGGPSDLFIGTDGYRYNVPVIALANAYIPGNPTLPVESWAFSNDPAFAGVPARGDASYFRDDTHDFDPDRTSIARALGSSVLTAAGGLLISKTSSATGETDTWAPISVVSSGSTAYWQIQIRNILPNEVTDAVFFDRLPQRGDDRQSQFDTTLAGPITGLPAGLQVEYSTDATDATSGTWSPNPAGATAFRITAPLLASEENLLIQVPTTIPQDSNASSQVSNNVQALATYSGSPSAFASNDAVMSVAAEPSFTLVKKTNGVVYGAAPGAIVASGSTVTWTYELHNTGNAPLEGISVTDSYTNGDGTTGTLTPSTPETGPLLPGDTRVFQASDTAIVGQYHNVATATATAIDPNGIPFNEQPEPATDESWYNAGVAGLTVFKTTNGQDVTTAPGPKLPHGSDVRWEYTVTNTGQLPLADVQVTDTTASGELVFEDAIALLNPGESVTLESTGKAVEGQYQNTVVAEAPNPAGGTPLAASDTSWYFGTTTGVAVEKRVSDSQDGPWSETLTVDSGTTVFWQITVTNHGNVPVDAVEIQDAALNESATVGPLSPGESATTVFTQQHVTASLMNVVVAQPSGSAEESSDTAKVTVNSPTGLLTQTGVNGGWLALLLFPIMGAGLALILWRRRA